MRVRTTQRRVRLKRDDMLVGGLRRNGLWRAARQDPRERGDGRANPQRRPPLAGHVGLLEGARTRMSPATWKHTQLCTVDDVSRNTEKNQPTSRGLWQRDCSAFLSFLEERDKSLSCAFTYTSLAIYFIQLSETSILKKCGKRQERSTRRAEMGKRGKAHSGARSRAVFSGTAREPPTRPRLRAASTRLLHLVGQEILQNQCWLLLAKNLRLPTGAAEKNHWGTVSEPLLHTNKIKPE